MHRALILAIAACALAMQSTTVFADDSLPEPPTCDCDGIDYTDYVDPGCACSLESGFDCDCECERVCGILPSDHCFDRFISPLSNPFFFEDPRSLTEVRGIYLDNSLPSTLDGGDAQVWAAQIRFRLSERWSVIAPRIGNLDVKQGGDGGAPDGFMSAPVGIKYNFYRDVQRQSLLSGGVTYFLTGSSSAFSSFGDGDFHFFLTGGQEIFDRGHWLSATGFRIPADSNWGTQLWYWSNQWDYEVVDDWYGVFGVNWFHWMRSGGVGIGATVTAIDLIDIPAAGVAGEDVASCLIGTKWTPTNHVEVGVGFEVPVTERTDILRNRLYADLILRF